MEPEQLWQKVLLTIKEKISAQAFKTWFAPTKGVSLKGNVLTVAVPNIFFIDWLEDHYYALMRDTLRVVFGRRVELKFRSLNRKQQIKVGQAHVQIPMRFYYTDASQLQRRYTFDTFVVGDSNRFAHAAALAVAKDPGRRYNPLYIYGSVGLGKTHLLQAIGNFVKEHMDSLKVYYVSCERFMNEMIDAIQQAKTIQFKKKYREKDLLLIDDTQFLAQKVSLQEEIFHTFNSLYDAGKQVVFASDRPPNEIPTLEERLVSRFQCGLVCDILPPSFETRVAILKQKAELSSAIIPDEVLFYIAERIKGNIRELEGALIKILALSSLTNMEITLDSIKEQLKDIFEEKEKRKITVKDVQEIVADHYGISTGAMKGKRRLASIALPRQVAIYLSRELTRLSLKEIGKLFGGRDHSTIIHDYEKIKKKIENDPIFSKEIVHLKEKIKSG
ncbi:MAG TPA: chromosomal replication initiator protein DnaA [bacterium (Candidatus Stahlbacteria)]|nr:chromosomal replication initiator protein DnaA [Candidatus Stahlbacteria bacterium]